MTEAVLIVDTHDVIRRALAVVTAVDQPPRQIEVSAQVLLVRRSGLLRDGVMAAVRRGHLTPGHLPPTVNFSCDGLPPGSCGSSAGLTVPAEELCRRLKQLTEVQVVATPHIQVLDRHAAEIGIEDQTAFRVFSAWGCPRSEQIEFLENGSRLWIRPTITTGNMIRLELAPRRSVVEVPRRGLPRQSTAEVTTDILIPHGCTLLVGGMWQEMTLERSRGVPVVGSWPGFDHLLSRRPAVTESAELVVLVTPWIVESAVQQTAVPW